MTKKVLISNEKLAILTNRVTKAIPVLEKLDAETMWEHPMEQFNKMSDNPSLIDTIILEENKNASLISSQVRKSEVSLACIYILLYYCHREEVFYKQFVFPELIKNMGVFGNEYLIKLNKKIENVLLMDKAMEEVEAEKKKNTKPLFTFPELSETERDELEKEYVQEKLYRRMSSAIIEISRHDNCWVSMPELWKAAKEDILFFCKEDYPEFYIQRILEKTDTQFSSSGDHHGQFLILCIYAMLRSVKKPRKLKEVISTIEKFSDNAGCYYILNRNIGPLKDVLDKLDMSWFDGYDYTQETQKPGNMRISSDSQTASKLEAMQNLLDQKEDELNSQKEVFEKQLEEKAQHITELEKIISEMPSPDLKLKIGENRKTDFIKVFYALVKIKVIEREDGLELTEKDAMKAFGTLFSDKTISEYSATLTAANRTSESRYYNILDEIRTVWEEYRKDSKTRKNE